MGAMDDMEKALRKRVNTKSYIPREAKRESYTAKYHRETLKQSKARKHPDSCGTTVLSMGVEHKGKVYNVAVYNRETKKDLSYGGAKFNAKNDIERGKIAGYSSDRGVYLITAFSPAL